LAASPLLAQITAHQFYEKSAAAIGLDARVKSIAKLVKTIPGVSTEIYIPEDGNRDPTLRVSRDQEAWGSLSRIAC